MSVTAVIPAYNAAALVGQAIESALSQTYSDVHVIVVDDGSTDGTATVAGRYGSRVSVVSTPNRGVSAARNEGASRAQTDYVAFLDADDAWEAEKLDRQVELLESDPGATMAVSGVRLEDSDGATLRVDAPDLEPDPCAQLLLGSMILGPVSSSVVRRSELSWLTGFDDRFSQCADWDFFLRVATGGRFAVVAEPLVTRRVHGANMSKDVELLERDTFAVLGSFFATPGATKYEHLRRRIDSNHWMILAGSYLEAGSKRDALRCLVRGLLSHPPNVRRPAGLPWRRLRSR